VASLKYIYIYTYANEVFYNRFEFNTVLIIHLEGCLTVHLPHEIKCSANLMQLGNFIDAFLARHVSVTYAHHQEH